MTLYVRHLPECDWDDNSARCANSSFGRIYEGSRSRLLSKLKTKGWYVQGNRTVCPHCRPAFHRAQLEQIRRRTP